MDYLHTLDDIRSNIRQVIVGKDTVIDHLLISLVCSGHVLIEDMPGLGKTTLASALASSLAAPLSASNSRPMCFPPTSPASRCST